MRRGHGQAYAFPWGGDFGENPAPGRKGRATVSLGTQQDMRNMDGGGVPRTRIAERPHVSRSTVAKHADMQDVSPAPPVPAARPHPALDPYAEWIGGVLAADPGAPGKQRHTAKGPCDRLASGRGYAGSCPTCVSSIVSFTHVQNYFSHTGVRRFTKKRNPPRAAVLADRRA